jgi:hypothetical protein
MEFITIQLNDCLSLSLSLSLSFKKKEYQVKNLLWSCQKYFNKLSGLKHVFFAFFHIPLHLVPPSNFLPIFIYIDEIY